MRAARCRDERGATLVIALVLVVVMSVAGTAVLNQQSSAARVQTAYSEVRDVELGLDAIVDQTIEGMRENPAWAVPGSPGPCSTTTGAGSKVVTYTYTIQGRNYELWCQADPKSAQPLGASGRVPDHAILVLGGMRGPGVAHQTNWTSSQDTYWPFCDDFHSFQVDDGGGDRCEASLFVGKSNTTADETTGGLYVKSNGSTSGQPLVVANGAIVISDKSGVVRKLTVEGGVWARRYCGYGKGKTSPGFTSSIGQYLTANPLQCQQGLDDVVAGTDTLKPDPDYLPVTILPAWKLPRVNAAQLAPYTLNATTLCAPANKGFAVMPAKKIGTTTVAGVTYPMYGAWYDSAADLNDVMNAPACKGHLFWFRPGVYYFDFLDLGSANKWKAAIGDIPETPATSNPASMIVGGMPTYDWGGGKTGANFCLKGAGLTDLFTANGGDFTQSGVNANLANCQQPPRVMIPQRNLGENGNDWDVDEDPASRVVPAGSVIGDNLIAEAWLANGKQEAQLISDAWQMPIPRTADVQEVKLEVPYKLLNSAGQGTSSFTTAYSIASAPRGGYIQVQLPNRACWLSLPAPGVVANDDADHLELATGDDGLPHAVDPKAIFDLTNGCDPTNLTLSGRIIKIDTGSSPFPSGQYGNGDTLKAHPDWINQMKVTVSAKSESAVTAPDYAKLLVDGVQLVVKWKGRPAPKFPGGCDRTLPGVQWVFGGTARIDWGNDPGNSMYAELCGTRRDQFPGYPNPNPKNACDDCNIAVFGMTEDAAGPPHLISTESTPTTFRPGQPVTTMAPARYCGGSCPPNPPDQTYERFFASSAGGVPAPADYRDLGGAYSYAQWPGNDTNNSAALSFRLPPDLVCQPLELDGCGASKIPAGSLITNVRLKVVHREGRANAVGCGSACIEKIKIQIEAGSTTTGSNGYEGAQWNSDTNVPNGWVQGTLGSASEDVPTCNSNGGWCTDVWGDWDDVDYPDWSVQRNLTEALATPEALQNARITYSVKGKDIGAANTHRAELDQLAVIVQYRPPTAPRPLAGCLTTRLGTYVKTTSALMHPSDFMGSGTDPNKYNGGGHDWLDADWAVKPRTASGAYKGDDPFTNYSTGDGALAGNGSTPRACPLLEMVSKNGGNPTIKFHIEGIVYAPSAALEFAGNDNDASWVSDAIIARHLSALRWSSANTDLPAVGGAISPRADRIVHLRLCDADSNCAAGKVRLAARVRYVDWDPVLKRSVPGRQVKVESWVRNPP